MYLKVTLFVLTLFFSNYTFGQNAFEIASDHLSKLEHYEASDLEDIFISSEYKTQHNGITHLYLKQRYQGIEIEDAINNYNIKNGQVLSFGERFSTNISEKVNTQKAQLTAAQALQKVMMVHDITGSIPSILEISEELNNATIFDKGDIAFENIKAELVYVKFQDELRLCWEINIYEKSCQNSWETQVDAITGMILKDYDHVIKCQFENDKKHNHDNCISQEKIKKQAKITLKKNAMVVANSYNVFANPVESPIHGDRTLEISPWLAGGAASTLGWHDDNTTEYTTSKGNNVDAYNDQDFNNTPTGGDLARVEGGDDLEFDFPLDLTMNPLLDPDPYITNLFYWNNLMHDVWYQYGFDEASGNFQEYNFENGGDGGDYVNAEGQDGPAFNNANFFTPVDGENPRMQMYLWIPNSQSDPNIDSDLDNGIIAHEYGHGISIRLTGGPDEVGCVNNGEHMGEGWSDFLGIWMTIEDNDNHGDSRGVGNYADDQEADGDGIRPAPYTTDMAVNDYTYEDVGSVSAPHGVGFVWCTMIWELNWALINAIGYDSNIYNGMGGNNYAAQLVIDGMKLQTCDPGFVDARNAILTANSNSPGGIAFSGIIWNVFARRGLGFSANQGSNTVTGDEVEAYDLPPGVALMTDDELFGALPLPIDLVNLRALPMEKDHAINLFWSTSSETENKGFDIQRRTENDSEFESISWLDGKGESETLSAYNFIDNNVISGKDYFYRLRQVDLNGSETYSDIVQARLRENGLSIEVFPNPSEGVSTVQFSDDFNGQVAMEVLNAQGQVIAVKLFETDGGAELDVDISQQPEGVYFLKFDINGELIVKQIVLKK